MENSPEGWINRIENGEHKYVNMVPQEGKEPNIKFFDNKIIYLPSEKQKYEQEVIKRDPKTVWLGVTGWKKPPKHYHDKFGTSDEKNIYETLVSTMLIESVLELKRNGINVDLRHGTSDAGVDAATMRVMQTISVTGSGVNCPLYMPWVTDDARGGPVYVAASKDEYHNAYSQYTQLLIVTGGRDVAFYHDYLRRMTGKGFSIVSDVIQTVSDKIVPATEEMPGKNEPDLNNAAAHIREKNSFGYNAIPRNFEELSLVTALSVLDGAYKVLRIIPNMESIRKLEQKISEVRNKPQQKITSVQLEERISDAKNEFLKLI